MFRLLGLLTLFCSAMLAFAAAPPPDDPARKPITTAPGEVGTLLRTWHAEGTAAGNAGDWYDNRDGEHSPLDLSPWPQLRKVAYSAADVKANRHWALQPRLLPHVVFGNSSTSAPPQYSGSNPRTYYCIPAGLTLLQAHYARNNLYIYPEHRDHDPGHNGVGDGYGDLYPTNTPFLLISQGSSGSDQPFMRAIPFTLAAFRPEVKKKLVETGLLMPTVQMILRATNRNIKSPEEYFTGKAHPTVFEGADVDALAMVKKAHAIRPDDIPPLVKLAVTQEETPVNGTDYFEPALLTEKLASTPTVIARVWRGSAGRRRLVVRAAESIDVNKKPLTFRWVVLRGDPKHVRITPRDRAGTEAEVVVDYHERRPIAPGSAMASNRVDIGVFASNGVHSSAPAFITFFSLDSESRTYDAKGRVVEIAHGMGFTELRIPDPVKLIAELGTDGFAAKFLRLDADQRKELARVGTTASAVAAQPAALAKALDAPTPVFTKGARAFVAGLLTDAMRSPTLWQDHPELAARLADKTQAGKRPRIESGRGKLVRLGIIADEKGDRITLRPLRPGKTLADRLTGFEKAMLEEFHALVLAELVVPGLILPVFHANFVDARLSAPKRWRDVYRHDGDTLVGWTRYSADGKPTKADYTPEGWRVTRHDEQGRPVEACTVEYRQAAPPRGTAWANPHPLEPVDGARRMVFTYEGGKRKIKSRE